MGPRSEVLETESQNLPSGLCDAGSLSVRGHEVCHPAFSPCPPHPPSGFGSLSLHPGTDLDLGLLAPGGGRETLGQPQPLHSVPALSSLPRQSTERWGWEEAGASQ